MIRKFHSTRRTVVWCVGILLWLLAVHDLSIITRQAGREYALYAMDRAVSAECSYAERQALKARIREARSVDLEPEETVPTLDADIQRCGIKAALHARGRIHQTLEYEGEMIVLNQHGVLRPYQIQLWSSLPVFPCRKGGRYLTYLQRHTGKVIVERRYVVWRHYMTLGCDRDIQPVSKHLFDELFD
ncbi:MAG: hypothetical protein Alpg2KO_30640 [Alphaproteobacteria bacterium]